MISTASTISYHHYIIIIITISYHYYHFTIRVIVNIKKQQGHEQFHEGQQDLDIEKQIQDDDMKLKKANTLLKEENLENLDLEPSNSVGPNRFRVSDDSSPSFPSPSPSPSPPRRKLNTHLRLSLIHI